MLQDLIQAVRNADLYSLIAIVITALILIFICLPSHEFAHAWAAHKLGDDTAKYQGRLTLNPFKHLDIIGTAMILLIGIGYAKPVPVNMFNFKNKKRDMALTALAGPMMNLIFGVIFVFLSVVFSKLIVIFNFTSMTVFYIYFIIHYALNTVATISIALAIFNLIPVPPFDGSRILGYFLPDRIYYKIMQYEQIIFIVVLALLWFGVLSGPISSLINTITNAIYWVISLPFGGI